MSNTFIKVMTLIEYLDIQELEIDFLGIYKDTACYNMIQDRIIIGIDFIYKHSFEVLLFALLHELGHKVYEHRHKAPFITNSQRMEKEADLYAINIMLELGYSKAHITGLMVSIFKKEHHISPALYEWHSHPHPFDRYMLALS